MDVFPNLTVTDVNKTPVSIDASGVYGATFDNPFYQATLSDIEKFIIYGGEPKNAFYDPKNVLEGQYSSGFLRDFISSCKSRETDFEVTINADPTKLDVAAGIFCTRFGIEFNLPARTLSIDNHDSKPVVYLIASHIGQSLTNPSSVVFLFANTPAAGSKAFTVAAIIVDGTTTARKVINYLDNIQYPFSLFADYMNRLGPWWVGLSITINSAATGFSTIGGDVDTYSAGTYRAIPAQTAIPFVRISTSLVFEYNISTFTIADFKKQGTGSISGNTTAVIWLVFAGMSGNFYMLAPYNRISLTANATVKGSDILDYYSSNLTFQSFEGFLAPVAAIVCYGNSNALSDLQIVAIANMFSNGKVTIAPVGKIYPLPSIDTLSGLPAVSAQLGVKDGQYALQGGLQIAKSCADGIVRMETTWDGVYPVNRDAAGQKVLPDGRRVYYIRCRNFLRSGNSTISSEQCFSDIPGLEAFDVSGRWAGPSLIKRIYGQISIVLPNLFVYQLRQIESAIGETNGKAFSADNTTAKYFYFVKANYTFKNKTLFGSRPDPYSYTPNLNKQRSISYIRNHAVWFSPCYISGVSLELNGILGIGYPITALANYINSHYQWTNKESLGSALCAGACRTDNLDKIPTTNTLSPLSDYFETVYNPVDCMTFYIVPNTLI